MPSTRRWSVPQRRIIISAVLALIGTFLACGGLGMGRWSVAAVGIAIIAIGGALIVLSAFNSRAMSEVEGTAHVVSRSAPPTGVQQGRCRLELIVSARGVDSVTVKTREPAVPVSKWPDRGADLPVMVAIDNPQRTRVLWHLVPTHAELATQRVRERGRTGAMPADLYIEDEGSYGDDFVPDLDPIVVETSTPTTPYVTSDDDAEAMTTSTGTRTIEMDVMDPSLMRWSELPETQLRRPPGSRPSPRPRRRETPAPSGGRPPAPRRAGETVDAVVIDEWLAPTEPPDEQAQDEAAVGAPPRDEAVDREQHDGESSRGESGVTGQDADEPMPDESVVEEPVFEEPAADSPTDAARRNEGPRDGQVPEYGPLGPPLQWPLMSAAAAAAAAALPHQWHEDEDDYDEPVEDRTPDAEDLGADYEGWFASENQPMPPHVPHNRPAPDEEADGTDDGGVDGEDVFETRDDSDGHDVTDDGPGYSRGPGYSPGTGYDDDTRYNPGTDYA